MKVSLSMLASVCEKLSECLSEFEKEFPEGVNPNKSFVTFREIPINSVDIELSAE